MDKSHAQAQETRKRNAQARREKEDREKNLAANRESRPDRHFGPVR